MSNKNFNHLILLIGTNPLPNFVVAAHFLRKNPNIQTIWLVHSEAKKDINQEGTYEFANNLRKLLQKEHQATFNFVPLSNVSKAKEIICDFKKYCLEKLESHSSVHVNYTGGTKVMCTHVYRIIEKQISNTSFSYLDAKTFRIIDDEHDALTDDLRQKTSVTISFEDMIGLHGFERVNEDKLNIEEDMFAETVEAFAQIITSGKLVEYFDWKNGGYNRKLFENENGELIMKKSHLNAERLQAYNPNETFLFILNSLPQGYRLVKDGKLTNTELASNKHCKRVIKFLDGLWFEKYITGVLEKHFELYTNWEIAKKDWEKNFELDIMMVQGYQLIGISCTTDKKQPRCKEKGFEIILRTRQIGGDEAKAIVITCSAEDDRKSIEQELRLDTGSGQNIMVLGIDDVQEEILLRKIKNFIK